MPSTRREDERPGEVTRVEFRLTDPEYPFVGASLEEGCRLVLEELVPRSDDYLEFFSVVDVAPDRVLDLAEDCESVTPTLLERFDGGGVFEFHVTGECVAVTLADEGALVRHLAAEEGTGRIVADVLPPNDANDVIEAMEDEHPAADVVAKRDRPLTTPLFVSGQLREALDRELTDKQKEVLASAYLAGYYDRPRSTTGEELAVRLDIAQSTFSKHLRAAEREVFSLVFSEPLFDSMGSNVRPEDPPRNG